MPATQLQCLQVQTAVGMEHSVDLVRPSIPTLTGSHPEDAWTRRLSASSSATSVRCPFKEKAALDRESMIRFKDRYDSGTSVVETMAAHQGTTKGKSDARRALSLRTLCPLAQGGARRRALCIRNPAFCVACLHEIRIAAHAQDLAGL